ncbi:MAG: hypothetical protein HKN30_00965 [Sulfitobacter sp.]|nr:hypothetical protein [Sulfitobacter sp.]
MLRIFRRFHRDEDGAVTVDWVVLTAAVCALAGVTYISAKDSSDSLANQTGSFLSSRPVGE